eukprot:gene6652-13469_t
MKADTISLAARLSRNLTQPIVEQESLPVKKLLPDIMLLKIVIAGPKSTGKTLIGNFLSGQSDKLVAEKYSPTTGVRILEFEIKLSGVYDDLNIELWDASGDNAYEGCWRAIMHEADGVVLVYNPDAPGQDQQIGDWFDYFVRKNGLKDEQCIVFAHRTNPSQGQIDKFRPPPLFSKVTAALTTPQSGPDMKGMFENFLKEAHQRLSNKNFRGIVDAK